MFVRNKMTANPFVISADQNIPDAQEVMLQYGVKRLPVVKKLPKALLALDIIRKLPVIGISV